MPRFLVSGLDGFIGKHLERELVAHGHEVVGPFFELTKPEVVGEAVAKASPEYVIHLAAISHVAHGAIEDFYKVNVIGTDNLLCALSKLQQKPKKVVLVSSANLYGNAAGDAPIAEIARVAPSNHYGVSKAAMELVADTYADRLPLVIVRPFNLTGVGQSPTFLIPKLVAAFAMNAPSIKLGNLDVARDFSDVRDVVRYMRLLAEMAPVGTTVNLCSGTTWSFQKIFDTLVELSGHRPAVIQDSELMRGNEIKVLAGDRTRLSATLGAADFDPRPFRETLSWMLQSWREVL